MIKRSFLSVLLFCLLSLAAWAQATSVYLLEYASEAPRTVTAADQDPVSILADFLKSGKDGKMTLTEDGQQSLVIEKAGDQLTITAPGTPAEKMSAKELLKTLDAAKSANP